MNRLKKRQSLKLFILASIVCCVSISCLCITCITSYGAVYKSNNNTAKIYFTDDVHGNIQNAYNEHSSTGEINDMSYATIASLKEKALNDGYSSYVVDAGDHSSGNIYTSDKGQTVRDIMDSTIDDNGNCFYDFATPGNHEFQYGMDYFLNNVSSKTTNFKYYATNFYKGDKQNRGDNLLEPYKIVNFGDNKKVAFVGIATPETIWKCGEGTFQDRNGNYTYYIDDAHTSTSIYQSTQSAIDNAKSNGADYVICVGHLGNEESAVKEGVDSTTVVQNLSGFDAFIDGHSHTAFNKVIKNKENKDVILVQAASGIEEGSDEKTGLNRIGQITIDESGKLSADLLTYTSEEVKSVTPNKKIKDAECQWMKQMDTKYQSIVAKTDIDFTFDKKTLKTSETNIGDLSVDAMYSQLKNIKSSDGQYIEPDASFMTSGSISKALSQGDIKYIDIDQVMPYLNNVSVCKMTGQALFDMLEYSLHLYPDKFNGYLQVAGIKFYFDSSITSSVILDESGYWAGSPKGEYRVNGVEVYNRQTQKYEPLDLSRFYNIASIDFLIEKFAYGYNMIKGTELVKYDVLFEDVLYSYIKSFNVYISNSLNNDIPYVSTATSPLSKYENYLLNYESKNGSGRITEGKKQTPITPTNNDVLPSVTDQIMLETANTQDYNNYIIYTFCVCLSIGGITFYKLRRRNLNWF